MTSDVTFSIPARLFLVMMKRLAVLLMVGSLVLLVGTWLRGQDNPRDLEAKFKDLDKNGDGHLTADELPKKLLSRLDGDSDGRVTLAEAKDALFGKGMTTVIEAAAKKADKNGDGLLSRAEAGNAKWFDRVDANADGQIDAAERRQAAEFLKTVVQGAVAPEATPAIPVDAPKPVAQGPKILTPAEGAIGRQIPDLSFTTLAGESLRLSGLPGKRGTVIAYTSTTCPVSKRYAPALSRLAREVAAQDLTMILVNPFASESREALQADVAAQGFTCAYVADGDDVFGKALEARTTTEVFLLDARRTLVYRGALDDQYGISYNLEAPRHRYVKEAVTALLAGQAPLVAATVAPGCELERDASTSGVTSDVTFHRDISRILQQNCVECHRDGGIAPFALDDAKEVLDRAKTIRRVINDGTMPPWFAAPAKEGPSPWLNDRSLSERDRKALLAWTGSADKPLGDPADAPLPKPAPPGGWIHGEPDVIIEIPRTVAIQAEGRMPYVNLTAPTGLTEDHWIRGYEIQPGDRKVVHHVLTWMSEGEGGGRRFDELGGFFAAYVPGNAAQMFPEGFGKKVSAGSSMRFQLHYTPSGQATEDRTRIGLYFSKEVPQYEVKVTSLASHQLSIPAGAPDHEVVASKVVPADMTVLGFMPHMHLRGKSFRFEVVRPEGPMNLLDVPRYDFNWQLSYRLKEPLFLPRGTQVRAVAHFDNSAANPANPDPTKTVKWGQQSDDEMMLGYVEFYVPVPAGEAPVAATVSR